MVGRRLPDTTWPDILPESIADFDSFQDGDYWLVKNHPTQPNYLSPGWYVFYQGIRHIPLHHVEEHEDGTITVVRQPNNSNSIRPLSSDREPQELWHGFIRRGVWERC